MFKLGIVVPYYQRQPGLLRRALDSALRGSENLPKTIVVVDDSSPNDPFPEIAELLQGGTVHLVRQSNGGPGAARNAGLNYLADQVSHIAFLDSDDIFGPKHLTKMHMAFEAGAQFYFSDTRRTGHSESQFDVTSFPRGAIEPFVDAEDLFWYRGSLLNLNLTRAPYGTNSIGYALEGVSNIRFSTEYKRACEDRHFVAQLARIVENVVFSASCDVELGSGVNIFAGNAWGTPEALVSTLDTMRFHQSMANEFPLTESERLTNTVCLSSVDRDFWTHAAACIIKRRWLPSQSISAYLSIRPVSCIALPTAMLRLITQKLYSGRKRPKT